MTTPSEKPGVTQPAALLSALPFYRGWTIVGAGFVCAMIAVGATLYSFGAIVAPVSAEFGLARAQTNSGFSLMLLGMALWSPFVGWLLDRAPARAVMIAGAGAFAAGMTLIALAKAPWVMGLAAFIPLGFGVSAGGALAANTVTTRWFRRRRGRAMGVLAVATSTGGFVITPLMACLVDTYDWRIALLVAGWAGGAAIALSALVFIRDRPAVVGLNVENEPLSADSATAAAQAAPDGETWTIPRMMGNLNFWMITLGAALLLSADQALIVSLIPYGLDRGFSLPDAAMLVAVLTASSIAGKLSIGLLADFINKRVLFAIVAACHVAFVLALIAQPSFAVLLLVAAFTGLATGGVYPVWTTFTAETFGSRSFGAVIGAMGLVMQPMAIVMVLLVGRSYDASGSYTQALFAFIGLAVVAALVIFQVRAPAVTAGQTPDQARTQPPA